MPTYQCFEPNIEEFGDAETHEAACPRDAAIKHATLRHKQFPELDLFVVQVCDGIGYTNWMVEVEQRPEFKAKPYAVAKP